MAQRIHTVQESDLRMLGTLARNIQRVLPVTQADIDAAAALGRGWVVKKVFEVSVPLDNMRGGTQLVIRENSITPGKNIQRVMLVSAPGGQTVIVGPGVAPIIMPDALAEDIISLKAFGGTEQQSLPQGYQQLVSLTTDGASYFDADYIINSFDVDVTTDAAMTLLSNGPNMLWGFMDGTNNLPRWGIGSYQSKWLYGVNATQSSTDITLDTNRHTLVGKMYYFDDTPMYNMVVDGVAASEMAIINATTIEENTLSAFIGARNNRGTAGSFNPSTFYLFKIEKAGELVVNMVPAKRLSDNVVGFYDTVRDRFFTNAGTGTITAGNAAVPTPDAPMDIWCNNGVLKVSPNLFDSTDTSALIRGFVTTAGGYSSSGSFGSIICKLTEGKTYTITRTISNPTAAAMRIIACDTSSPTTSSTQSLYMGTSSDKIHTITVPSGYPYIVTYVKHSNDSITDQELLDGFQVELGSTATPIRPYGQIYTDGTVETISVIGKNIWDESWRIGSWSVANNKLTQTAAATRISSQNLIKVIPGATYTLSVSDDNYDAGFYVAGCVDIAGNAGTNIKTTNSGNTSTFTVPASTNYIVFAVRPAYGTTYVNNIQLESGSTATDYQAYHCDTATCEDLLSVGDYTDEQEVISGAVTRKVGVKVLDGTEDWVDQLASSNSRVNLSIIDMINDNTAPLLVTHGEWSLTGAAGSNVWRILTGRYISCKTSEATLADFKQYLAAQYGAGTPVIVVYPLTTATSETVTAQPMATTQGDNIADITQASIDGLELEVTYKAGVTLTVEEVEDAQLSPDVEVTIQ